MGGVVSGLLGAEEAHTLTDPLSIEVGEALPNEGRPRRNYKVHDRLVCLPFEDEPDIDTAYKVFERSVKKYPDNPFLGEREVLADNKRGDFVWETYGQVALQVAALGTFLKKRRAARTKIGVFSINRKEWTVSMLALWSQDFVCVPLYDTLGASAIEYIVNHCQLDMILCSGISMDKLIKADGKMPSLKTVVVFDAPTPAQLASAQKYSWEVLFFPDVIKEGMTDPHPPGTVDATELAYIMYTSGTTGDPKGVMLTHRNLMASAAGLHLTGFDLGTDDVYLSYLPLAHSFEACLQLLCICAGGAIGFYQGDAKLLLDDIKVLRPTVFAGVPRVYSRIYERVMSIADQAGWLKSTLFHRAYEAQLSYVRCGQRNTILDALIFNKIAAQLGGRVRLMATGAAPMPVHVMEFLKVVFKCPVYQGFGMTENAAAAMVMPPGYNGFGTVGGPLPCTEVKLVDVPEMGYLSANTPPGGEICLRGPNVFKGYFQLEKETAEALDRDGWLHTGDVGVWEADGSLRIVDRKKNIFKLAQGEFVAAEELENIYGKSKYISQLWVYGNSFQTSLVAVAVPNVEAVMRWAADQGRTEPFSELAANGTLRTLLLDDIAALAKAAKVASFKIPKAIHIETDLNHLNQGFTIENETLTPTFKLRRPQLLRRYQSQVDEMYKSIPAN